MSPIELFWTAKKETTVEKKNDQWSMDLYFGKADFVFLAVQNSSIGLIVCPLVPLSVTTNNQSLHNTTE